MMRPRGRPRSFNEVEVKDVITRVFWERGFSATSLDDLARATGLTRPSLYGAFGNKLSMYLMTLDVFSGMMRDTAGQALWKGRTIRAALSRFYSEAINIYLGNEKAQPNGCLVYTTAVTEAVSHPEIKAALNRQIKSLENALRERLANLCPGTSKAKLNVMVSLAVSTLHSLAIRARVGTSRAELSAFVKRAIVAVEAVAETK
jgi:TetR/AcrR family transcriptional regulator, copper-responsive repressor